MIGNLSWVLLLLVTAPAAAAANAPVPAPVVDPHAAGAPPSAEPKTLMCERGKLLFSDDFTSASLAKNWYADFGTWECKDGGVTVSGPADKHHPLKAHRMALTDAIVQVDFRFAGADWLGVGWDNEQKGHVIRCNIHPTKWDVSRWFNLIPGSKDDTLDARPADLAPGRWYTLVWELRGTESLASIDERLICYGHTDGVDLPKNQLDLFSANGPGQVAEFAHVKVWEVAGLMPGWERTQRARVLQFLKKPERTTR